MPSLLKNHKKGLTLTWSEFYDSEGETANKITTFTGKYESEEESSDEDISEEELVETFIPSGKNLALQLRVKRKP